MNPNTIPWEHYQDLQVSDIELKSLFDQYISAGNYVEALKLLRTNKEKLMGKAYVSKTINTILTGILELQSLYNNNVNIFLSDLAISYENLINNFNEMGSWSADILYVPYNFVIFNDEIYMAYKNMEIGTLPTNESYWLKLGLKGADGAYSVDTKIRYQWSNTQQYSKNDIVVYKENLYIALKKNINAIPSTSTANWLLFIGVLKGGIIVSEDIPDTKTVSQNSVWLKTDNDVLSSTMVSKGQFYRYTGKEWEEMYPSVLFTLINNATKYAPLAKIKQLKISTDKWSFMNGIYYYVYEDRDIKQNSYINILPVFDSPDSKTVYNILKAEYDIGAIRFSVKVKPIYDLKIQIKIQ